MLSTWTSTAPDWTLSARADSSPMNAVSSSVAGTTTVSAWPLRSAGVGSCRSSAVLMSALTCHMRSSSGTLRNFAKRDFIR